MTGSTRTDLITKETIQLDLEADSKFDAIRALCGLLFGINRSNDPSLLYRDIVRREEAVSTFAGTQTAIPHAISDHISVPTLCFARTANPDFTWDGKDQAVRFVFLLSAPSVGDLKQLRQSMSYVFSSVAQLICQPETLELWETATEEQVILDSLSSAFEAYQNK